MVFQQTYMSGAAEESMGRSDSPVFPTSGNYVGSRLDDMRVMQVACERYQYNSLNIQDSTDVHWMLSFVKRGNVQVTCLGQNWQAKTGDLMIFPPFVNRSEIADEPGLHEYLLVDATVSERLDLFQLYPVTPVVSLIDSDEYSARFGELFDISHARDSDFWGIQTVILTMQLLSMALAGWRNSGSPERPGRARSRRFADVVTYMNSHIADRMTRADLARRSSLHPVYLDRAFGDAYGMSCMQMLRTMRISKAKDLLENTDMPLEAVAEACGLGTASYLIRVFHRAYGATPHDHRRSYHAAVDRYYVPE